jgi:hypothetical protein
MVRLPVGCQQETARAGVRRPRRVGVPRGRWPRHTTELFGDGGERDRVEQTDGGIPEIGRDALAVVAAAGAPTLEQCLNSCDVGK